MERAFKARTQINNFKGSAAADESDSHTPEKWLKDNKYIHDGEYIAGIELSFQENHEERTDIANVQFLVLKSENIENIPQKIHKTYDPLPLRKIDIQMNFKDFFFLFKWALGCRKTYRTLPMKKIS
ncbi:MAG: hypothetical protein R6U55_16165 [Desulfovermiculus sp.]